MCLDTHLLCYCSVLWQPPEAEKKKYLLKMLVPLAINAFVMKHMEKKMSILSFCLYLKRLNCRLSAWERTRSWSQPLRCAFFENCTHACTVKSQPSSEAVQPLLLHRQFCICWLIIAVVKMFETLCLAVLQPARNKTG